MGKRELLIICAFAVVGVIAYAFTAPPRKPGERGFSITQIFSGIKREISENASSAKVTKSGAIALGPMVTELRVSTYRSVPIKVVGEDRKDIVYEMPVESTGPDEATARGWADKSEVRRDDLGMALALSVYFPEEGTQHASLLLRVPARLAVRVENSGRIEISQVAAVELLNPAGEVTISAISGAISGSHRSGELQVNGAKSVDLSLSSSRSRIRGVTQTVKVNARNGECSIAETTGTIEATVSNLELTINGVKSSIRIGGDGGTVKVVDSHALSIDARRMAVDIETSLDADDRIAVITSDEPLRIALGGTPSFVLDVINTNGGSIRASDFKLEPVKEGRDSKLIATVGKGGAQLVLRNSRRDIVIGQRK